MTRKALVLTDITESFVVLDPSMCYNTNNSILE